MNATASRAQAYRIFAAALDLPVDERGAFIQSQCGDDPILVTTVRSLLRAAVSDLDTGVLLEGSASALPDRSGWICGPFRLLESLGAGGMGCVYRAERTDGVPQIVAIKVLHAEVIGSGTARFLREARMLARLEHPAIARLIDVGTRDGTGWIAMEFVRGRPITDYCDAERLDVKARVRLLLNVADAISTAHRNLVVHRDIKPTNVLVTDEGQAKLIDFGIAAAVRDSGDRREPTADIGRLFTPNYAAPEQVRGEPVSVATDVFGLGALAYRLLSGSLPYAQAQSAVSYLLAVTQQDVEAPSRAAVAANGDQNAARELRGDLDAILMKALQRDPQRRYATVQDLAADLTAYLEERPVRARPPSVHYRLGKYVRRRALALSVAFVIGVGLAAGALIYSREERTVAQARNAALLRGQFLEDLLRSPDPNHGRRDITVAELLTAAAAGVERRLSAEPLVQASMLGLIAQSNTDLGRYQEALTANTRELQLLRNNGGSQLDIGRALTVQAGDLRAQGRWPEADAAIRQAVAVLRPLNDIEDLCAALDMLGATQSHTHQEQSAYATYLEEIALESRGSAELRNRRLLPYYALADLLGGEWGRYSEAATYARAAWDLARATLPADNPDRFTVETGYARSLVNLDRGAEAEPLLRDVVAHATRVLGPDHHDRLISQIILGEDLIQLNRNEEAAQLTLDAANRLQATLGEDNAYALMAWDDYGIAECNLGHDQAGLAALRHVEMWRVRTLAPEHRLIHSVRTAIGVCLIGMRQYAAAEPLLLAAAAALEKARGPDFRATQAAYRALRQLNVATNRPEQAALWAAKLRHQ
jgi:serine/threonine-protein kinase